MKNLKIIFVVAILFLVVSSGCKSRLQTKEEKFEDTVTAMEKVKENFEATPCTDQPTEEKKNLCYISKAMKEKDSSLCEKISDEVSRKNCMLVALK